MNNQVNITRGRSGSSSVSGVLPQPDAPQLSVSAESGESRVPRHGELPGSHRSLGLRTPQIEEAEASRSQADGTSRADAEADAEAEEDAANALQALASHRKRSREFNPREKAQILIECAERPVSQVAKDHGLSVATVWRWTQQDKSSSQKPAQERVCTGPISMEEKAAVLAQWRLGDPKHVAATAHGLNPSTASKWTSRLEFRLAKALGECTFPGANIEDIARANDIPPADLESFHERLQQVGPPPPEATFHFPPIVLTASVRPKISPEMRKAAVAAHKGGTHIADVALAYGVNRSTVRKWIRRLRAEQPSQMGDADLPRENL